MTHPWERTGDRVRIAPVNEDDLPELRRATERSRDRLTAWGPDGVDGLDQLLAQQGSVRWTFLVHALAPAERPGLAARIDLNHPIGGRLSGATLGYEAFDPYAGRGLTREGVSLLLGVVFAAPPDGLGLHRVEAGVQPANVRSAALLRAIGFRREGHAARLVRIPTLGDPDDAWRDHDMFAVTAEEWPATPYAAPAAEPVTCLVTGMPGAGKSTLAPRLARELGLPVLGKDAVKESFADALPDRGLVSDPVWQQATGAGASLAMWKLLRESPIGAVVETYAPPDRDAEHVRAGLVAAGIDPSQVVEVFCDVPVTLARERYEARAATPGARHVVHRAISPQEWDWVGQQARPLGLGPVLLVDTSAPVPDAQVCRVALRIRAHTRCQEVCRCEERGWAGSSP